MRIHITRWSWLVWMGIFLVVPQGMSSAQDAQAILKRVSEIMNAPKDRNLLESVEIRDEQGNVKKRTLQILEKRQQGTSLRLVRFLEPAEVKGVSFLSLGEDRMYLYMPAFRKIRRIASHVKNENFMGTDFSYEDLSETDYEKKYDATLLASDEKTWTLKLTPKPGTKSIYSYSIMRVDRQTNYPILLELYQKDKLFKRLELLDLKKWNGYLTANTLRMTTVATGHQTILRLQQAQFDQGLSKDLFTLRNLKRWRNRP